MVAALPPELDFTRLAYAETLFCSAVAFHFWHFFISSVLVVNYYAFGFSVFFAAGFSACLAIAAPIEVVAVAAVSAAGLAGFD